MNYIRIIFCYMLFSFSFGETLLVPENYSRIQRAIDSAVEGDTVLVNTGTYCENIILNKSVTLASYAISENLDNWLSEDGSQVENATILNTIIDGSEQCLTDNNQAPPPPSNHWLEQADRGSVILVVKNPDVDDCLTPTIYGFTIQGGSGSKISRNLAPEGEEPFKQIQRIGGGILSRGANPIINYNQIKDNDVINNNRSGFPGSGSGIQPDGDEDFDFVNYHGVEIDVLEVPSRCDYDMFDFTNNFFYNNSADDGNTIYNKSFNNTSFDLSGSSFDVVNCETGEVSSVWVDIHAEATSIYSDIQHTYCGIQTPNVYIDPNIESECLTIDCGTQENKFKTVTRALAMISADEQHPITLDLVNGTYSPDTGESFPITLLDYVSLKGQHIESTILDAMQTGKVLVIDSVSENTVSKLTIMEGNVNYEEEFPIVPYKEGAGIYVFNSDPILKNLEVKNNHATYGAGIFLQNSYAILRNVTIRDNTAFSQGGGIKIKFSSPELYNVTIKNNNIYANPLEDDLSFLPAGAGMYMIGTDNPILSDVTINGNTSSYLGGGLFMHSCIKPLITNTLIFNNSAEAIGGGIYIYDSEPIFNFATISNNFSSIGGGIFLSNSLGIDPIPIITNSMVWGNVPNIDIEVENNDNAPTLDITYSNIGGGWYDYDYYDYVLNYDPLFVDPENEDYTLQDNSQCIDAGNPNLWYQDSDGSIADMGFTGGSLIYPNFIEHDFGVVGDFNLTTNLTLHNFRDTEVIISGVSFSTENFYSSTIFPITIEPFSKENIAIVCSPEQNSGDLTDNMIIDSPDLEQGTFISLFANGSEGILLSGNLPSGILPVNTYIINGDINVVSGDEVILQGGTSFLFDGEYDFIVEGTLKAEGTVQDSIIFDIYDDGGDGDDEPYIDCTDGSAEYEDCIGTCFNDADCTGGCLNWLGDGYCDDGTWELVFTCDEYGNDCGDCGTGGDPYGACDLGFTCTDGSVVNAPEDCEVCAFDTTQYGAADCDAAYDIYGISCSDLEYNYNWDCTGCNCPGDNRTGKNINGLKKLKNQPSNISKLIPYYSPNRLKIDDSSIFRENNSNREDTWRGLTLNNVTEETIFEYVRISGASKSLGGGMKCTDSNPILSHMTISGNSTDGSGAGIYLVNSNATLTNLHIHNNEGTGQSCAGGGLRLNNSDAIIDSVIISNNYSWFSGGIDMVLSNPIITNTTIKENFSGWGGGITLYTDSNPTLINVSIYDNEAGFTTYGGGGIYMMGATNATKLINVNISNNKAGHVGGGLLLQGSSPTLINVTMSGNTTTTGNGGGIYIMWIEPFDGSISGPSNPILTNSIIWDNNPQSIFIENGAPDITTISHCDIQGEWGGNINGNLHVNPLFVDPENNDFNLQADSPCIDAGIADLNDDGIEDITYNGLAPDMGAFESGVPDIVFSDLNNDQDQNILDIVILINIVINNQGYNILGDLNQDGTNDILDIVQLVNIVLVN